MKNTKCIVSRIALDPIPTVGYAADRGRNLAQLGWGADRHEPIHTVG